MRRRNILQSLCCLLHNAVMVDVRPFPAISAGGQTCLRAGQDAEREGLRAHMHYWMTHWSGASLDPGMDGKDGRPASSNCSPGASSLTMSAGGCPHAWTCRGVQRNGAWTTDTATPGCAADLRVRQAFQPRPSHGNRARQETYGRGRSLWAPLPRAGRGDVEAGRNGLDGKVRGSAVR